MRNPLKLTCAGLLAFSALTLLPAGTWAQQVPAPVPASASASAVGVLPAAPPFAGTTFDGHHYDLSRRRGRVVMVVLWRTDCAVCLSKMAELRANALGWKAAPFDLVLINLDPTDTDAEAYDKTRRQVANGQGPVLSFWHGNSRVPPGWRSVQRLPRTVIIDREGRIAASYDGRFAPEAWNQVADLLP
jgi:peroxiredoxin